MDNEKAAKTAQLGFWEGLGVAAVDPYPPNPLCWSAERGRAGSSFAADVIAPDSHIEGLINCLFP